MKVTAKLSKFVSKDFRPTLQRVMQRWSEHKDIMALVKIAKAIEEEQRIYSELTRTLSSKLGYELPEVGRRTSVSEEITDHLLKKFGNVKSDGQLSMAGASKEDMEEFLECKLQADECIHKYNAELEGLLKEDHSIEIPRLVKVTDKMIKKEVITAHDCFILEPILDLSEVSSDADKETTDQTEEDEEV